MQPNDFTRFHAVMTGLAELHQRELSQFLLDAYWLAMRDWSIADFESAASHLMQTMTWMPKPSDFTALKRAGETTSAEAWTEALASCVNWRNPDQLPTGRVARAAAAVGGFRMIAMADQETALPFIEKRFKEAYDELTDVESVREALPQIAKPEARIALRGPVHAAKFIPDLQPSGQRKGDNPPKAAQVALPAPKPEPKPTKSPREKVLALAGLHADFSAEDIARIAGESVETVREILAQREHAA